jgi:Cu-Zn family superoxide dismutase
MEDMEGMANPSPTSPMGDAVLPAPSEKSPPVLPPPPLTPAPLVATAELTKVKGGDEVGTVTFELGEDNVISINGDLGSLPPGKHAIYIHEGSDCGSAKQIGGHLDPTGAKHGPPSSANRHAGDFGNLVVDDQGKATFTMDTDSLSFEAGRADTLTGRTLVVHAKADNARGNPGAAIACGLIELQQAPAKTE